MTDAPRRSITEAEVRLLVTDAQAVVQRTLQLPTHAVTNEDHAWAQFRSERTGEQWQELLSVLRESRAESFTSVLRTIISNSVPLQDAPTELAGLVDSILELNNRFAGDYGDIIDPLVRDRRLFPDVYDQLREILARLAPEFDTHA
jgi:hypothetical protein